MVEDPATGLHRPRDYMQTLEARVAYLEGLLQEQPPDAPSNESGFSGNPVVSGTHIPNSTHAWSPSPNINIQSTRYEGVAKVDHLSSEVALLCLSAAGRDPRYFGQSSAVSFSRIASQTIGIRGPSRQSQSFSPNGNVIDLERSAHAAQMQHPSSKVAEKLSEAYFHNIHPQYPFLHCPTFREWEQEFQKAKLVGRVSETSPMSSFFPLMVYAIGSLALEQSGTNAAESYYSAALDQIGPVLEMDSLESIQAILCCAVYSIRSPLGASLWKLSGMAMRHCIELGLHRSTQKLRKNVNRLREEMSIRCFWVSYDMDRCASSILGRCGGISDFSIDAELPLDIDDENVTMHGLLTRPRSEADDPPTDMTGAIHVIKLRRICSKICTPLSPSNVPFVQRVEAMQGFSTEELRKELEDWKASTPRQLGRSRSQPLSVFASPEWYQLAYNHCIMLLYRRYITGTDVGGSNFPQQADDGIIDRALEECYARAGEMCHLYRRLYQSPSIQFTWGSLHMLFLGGLTYLYCLWRSRSIRETARQTDVMNTCMACTTVLVIIAERWKPASSYRDLFETLSERTINMICGESVSTKPVFNDTVGGKDFNDTVPTTVPFEDWINNLQKMEGPQESEWFIQELMQGVQSFEASGMESLSNDVAGFDFLSNAFDLTHA